MKKISIKDIATMSGVSVATVSRVINDNGRFSEETRKKVLEAIAATGYQTNYSAKSLRMNKSFSIGILVPDISNFFFADIVQKIEEILFAAGYSTIICNTGRNTEKEYAYLSMLESKMVDGIIVISGADEFGFDYSPSEKNIPYICIDREPKDKTSTVFISSNHYQGAFDATEELIHAGAKHPIIAMHTRTSPVTKERYNGFRDALKKHSITFTPEQNQLLLDFDNNAYGDDLVRFLKKVPATDGIFALNDSIALELMTVLFNQGRKVPEEIKVIGFDNTPQANYSYPTLSSVQQDTQKIAQTAVDNLVTIISNKSSLATLETLNQLIPVKLIIRNSTGSTKN